MSKPTIPTEERFKAVQRYTFDMPPRPYWAVVETVGIHKGEPITISWPGLYTTQDAAERAIEIVKAGGWWAA